MSSALAKTATTDAAARVGWAAALDTLEVSLDAAARTMAASTMSGSTSAEGELASALTIWTPPVGLGALPADFAVRAGDLLINQQKLIIELEQARSVTLKHLTAVRLVPSDRDARASVYLDVAG